MKVQHQINVKAYQPSGFVEKYQRLVKDVMIPYQYNVLADAIPDAEKSHVIKNFINAAAAVRGEDTADGFYGMVFQDSDAGKWIEAVAYSLSVYPDEKLEKLADELIDLIAAAQDTDGYLNTYYTIKDKDKRWTNLLEGHELYCSGHLIEAACAYYEVTGKRKLLDVMLKNVKHIYNHFVTEKHEGCPGHPEIELALVKLYRATSDEDCLKLAEHFVNVRGVDPDYFRREVESRDWRVWGADGNDIYYQQSFKPVREQQDATGHAVRAVYLYTGMADLASCIDDNSLVDACKTLWNSITHKRMYITGGIGSSVNGEAFTVDYDLPNDTAYAETCASIGLMFFASRMLENEIDSKYADVMEIAFYNTVLAGIQLDGKRYFYVNPLEIVPGISGVCSTHPHTLTQRPGWYACACCPPNAARLIASLGKYAYGENETTAFCHMFAAGSVQFENGMKLTCETEYPYDFTVKYTVSGNGNFAIRIPAWSKNYTLTRNGEISDILPDNGYVTVPVTDGDAIALTLDSSVRKVYASPKVPELTGCACLCRGPLVYCFEGVDNGGDVLALSLQRNGAVVADEFDSKMLCGISLVRAETFRTVFDDALYSETQELVPCNSTAVPYYTWGNRGENQMRVWLPIA